MNTHVKAWHPYISPFDPCKPILVKTFSTPPHLYWPFQPPNMPQFSPYDALRHGTLWPALFDDYQPQQT